MLESYTNAVAGHVTVNDGKARINRRFHKYRYNRPQIGHFASHSDGFFRQIAGPADEVLRALNIKQSPAENLAKPKSYLCSSATTKRCEHGNQVSVFQTESVVVTKTKKTAIFPGNLSKSINALSPAVLVQKCAHFGQGIYNVFRSYGL